MHRLREMALAKTAQVPVVAKVRAKAARMPPEMLKVPAKTARMPPEMLKVPAKTARMPSEMLKVPATQALRLVEVEVPAAV